MRTPDPIADADRYHQAVEDDRAAHERRQRARELGDVVVTLGDGTVVELRGVLRRTPPTWTDPGEPWEWSGDLPEDVDERDVVDALEDTHG